MVLRSRIRGRDEPPLPRQTLPGALRERSLPRPIDTLHALLPVVQDQSPQTLETEWQPPLLQGLQVGNCERVLELLCMVPGADPA